MIEELAGMTSVFAGDQIDFAQHAQGPLSDVFQIPDWSRDQIERAGHGRYSGISNRQYKPIKTRKPRSFTMNEAFALALLLGVLRITDTGNAPVPRIVVVRSASIDIIIARSEEHTSELQSRLH